MLKRGAGQHQRHRVRRVAVDRRAYRIEPTLTANRRARLGHRDGQVERFGHRRIIVAERDLMNAIVTRDNAEATEAAIDEVKKRCGHEVDGKGPTNGRCGNGPYTESRNVLH